MSPIELVWDGKYDAQGNRRTVQLPSDLSPLIVQEAYGSVSDADTAERNRLICGDNKAALAALLPEYAGKVNLIYMDPPFAVGTDFTYPVLLGEETEASFRAVAYRDTWGKETESYLHQMWERITLLRDLLAEDGTLYVHCDWRMNAPLRLILDEVFGSGATVSETTPGFRCEIAWLYREAVNRRSCWNRKHDTLLMYTKSARWYFDPDAVLQPLADSTVRKYRHRDTEGRRYRLMGRGITNSPIRSARDISPEWEKTHPELTFRHYLKDGTLPLDYWQIDIVNQASAERTDYPTQKPEALLERILLASSRPGDLVLDPFCGSGTTPVVAELLGRRWIACDASPWAIHTTRKRLLHLYPEAEEATVSPFGLCTFSTAEANETIDVRQEGECLSLRGLIPDHATIPLSWQERAEYASLDFVDGWAVGPAPESGEPFHPIWQDYRTRRNRSLETVAPLPTGIEGWMVHVVDVLGKVYRVEGNRTVPGK